MSPVARTDRHAGKALLVAGAGVGFALGMAFLFAVLANRGDVKVRLGDDLFDAGRVESISGPISDEGPLLFSDAASGGRHIFVQHLGDDLQSGWLAFSAFDPNDKSCLVDWKGGQELFVNRCDPEVTYPADGKGLRQYGTTITNGRLQVDLNSVERQKAEQDAETNKEEGG